MPSSDSSKPSADDAQALDEAKAKMREALKRKSGGSHPTGDSARNTGAVHGPEVVGDAKRTFKPRKTG